MDFEAEFNLQTEFNHFSKATMILPGLFLGPLFSSSAAELKEQGVTHVLRVISGPVDGVPSDVDLYYIEADDCPSQDLLMHFDETHAWIAKALAEGGQVLVHCYAGVSRSASIVIAYVMKELNLDFDTAYQLVHRARPVVSPNEGFEKQLRFYRALGCTTRGSSAAHNALDKFLLTEEGEKKRLNAIEFLHAWQELSVFS